MVSPKHQQLRVQVLGKLVQACDDRDRVDGLGLRRDAVRDARLKHVELTRQVLASLVVVGAAGNEDAAHDDARVECAGKVDGQSERVTIGLLVLGAEQKGSGHARNAMPRPVRRPGRGSVRRR